jgi:hypothetical protein
MWMQVGALEYDTPIPPQQYVDSTFADHVAH